MRLLKQVITAGVIGAFLVAAPAQKAAARQGIDDDALEARIESEFEASPSLAARGIDIEVKQGTATLTGKVRTAEEKATAGKLASEVRGVGRVSNQLEVDPDVDRSTIDKASDKTKDGLDKAVDATNKAAHKTKEAVEKGIGKSEEGVGKATNKTSDVLRKVGDKATDASLTTLVNTRFSSEKLLSDSSIDVDTDDRVVTLTGTVGSDAAKAKALDIARTTDGVRRVIDNLAVRAKN